MHRLSSEEFQSIRRRKASTGAEESQIFHVGTQWIGDLTHVDLGLCRPTKLGTQNVRQGRICYDSWRSRTSQRHDGFGNIGGDLYYRLGVQRLLSPGISEMGCYAGGGGHLAHFKDEVLARELAATIDL